MLLTLVDNDTYSYKEPTHSIIAEKESDHVPSNGDLIKTGHSLSSFDVYRVEGRVFRSKPSKSGTRGGFDQVFLLVSKLQTG